MPPRPRQFHPGPFGSGQSGSGRSAPGPRASGAGRSRVVPLPVLFLLAGVLEISVLVLTSNYIGSLATVGLLVLGAVLGTWLLRREGRRTVREVTEAARARRAPTRGIEDGLIIAACGILIVVPGLISDVVGLIGLLPPVRSLVRRRLQRAAERRSRQVQDEMRKHAHGAGAGWVGAGWPGAGGTGADWPGAGPASGTSSGRRGDFIDGEVVSVDEDGHSGDGSTGDGRSGDGSTPPDELPPQRSSRADRPSDRPER